LDAIAAISTEDIRNSESHLKLAERVAESLERQIVKLGCPIGLALGNESELAAKFNVSRWVLREAIAITERDGLTEMRRGRAGGLVVATTADSALAAAICNYLLFTQVDVAALLEVRKIVDRYVYVLAAKQFDDRLLPEAVATLTRAGPQSPSEGAILIYDQILRLSNNAFVGAFGASLSKLTRCLLLLHGISGRRTGPDLPISLELLEIRKRQLGCVIAADLYGVVEASAAAADAWREMFSQAGERSVERAEGSQIRRDGSTAEQIAEVLNPGKRPKLPNIVATRLGLHLLDKQLRPGDLIALEADLMAMLGVGRHVLREGIRILERDGIVQSEVGRRGGIKVGSPNAASVAARAVNYLRIMGVDARDVEGLGEDMLVHAAELAATKRRANRGLDLATLEREVAGLEITPVEKLNGWLFHLGAVLAALTRNPILELFFDIVLRFGVRRSGSRPIDRDAVAVSARKLVVALDCGDVPIARRAMAKLTREIAP